MENEVAPQQIDAQKRAGGEKSVHRAKYPSYAKSLLILLRPFLVTVLLVGSFNAIFYHLPFKNAFEQMTSIFYNLSSMAYFIIIMLAFAILERFDRRNNLSKDLIDHKNTTLVVMFFFLALTSSTFGLNYSIYGLDKFTITYVFSVVVDSLFYSSWLFIVLAVLYAEKRHSTDETNPGSNIVFFTALVCGIFRALVKVSALVVENYHASGSFVVPDLQQTWFFVTAVVLTNALFAIFVVAYFVFMSGKISRWFYLVVFLRIASFFIYQSDSFTFSSVAASIAFYFFIYAAAHYLTDYNYHRKLNAVVN